MKVVLLACLFTLPLKVLQVTSPFGFRLHPVTGKFSFHNGVDLHARSDTVYAVMDGEMTSGYDSSLGSFLRLSSGGLQATYGHLSRLLVMPGARVTAGTALAVSGASGRVTAPHLHFSLSYQRHYLNPLQFLLYAIKNQNHEQKLQTPVHAGRRRIGGPAQGRYLTAAEARP